MKERDYRFTPPQANIATQGLTDSVEHFARGGEASGEGGIEEFGGPTVLSPENLSELDSALNVAGYMPSELVSVDPNILQREFTLLCQANDREARKVVYKRIVELIRAIQ